MKWLVVDQYSGLFFILGFVFLFQYTVLYYLSYSGHFLLFKWKPAEEKH